MSRVSKLNMNWFKDEPKLTDQDREQFHVITVESRSYETKEHEILVPVGTQNVWIPAEPSRYRTVCKVSAPSTQLPDEQQEQDQDKKTIKELTEKIEVLTREKENRALADVEALAEVNRALDDAEASRALEQRLVHQLQAYYKSHHNTVAAEMTLQTMPKEVCAWIAPWFNRAHHDDMARRAAKHCCQPQEKHGTGIPAHHRDRTRSPQRPTRS